MFTICSLYVHFSSFRAPMKIYFDTKISTSEILQNETLLRPQRGQEASVQMESLKVTQTAKRARGKCSNGKPKRSDRKEGKRQVSQMESRNVTQTTKRARGKCSNGKAKRYSDRKEGKRQVFKWKVAPVRQNEKKNGSGN